MDERSGFILGMLLASLAGMLVALWWVTLEDRHFYCIPINGHSVKYVPATRSTVESTVEFYHNLGFRWVGVDSDLASKTSVYCMFERG